MKRRFVILLTCLAVAILPGCSSSVDLEDQNYEIEDEAPAAESSEEASEPETEDEDSESEEPEEATEETSTASEAASKPEVKAADTTAEKATDTTASKPAVKAESAPAQNVSSSPAKADNQAPGELLPTPKVNTGVLHVGENAMNVEFTWAPVEGAEGYEVLAEDKFYKDDELSYKPYKVYGQTTDYYNTVETKYVASSQDYFDFRVQVRAYKGEGANRRYSKWSDFAYGNTQGNRPAAPKVVAGTSHQVDDHHEVDFTWQPVEGVKEYRVTVWVKTPEETEYKYKETVKTTDTKYACGAQDYFDYRVGVEALGEQVIDGAVYPADSDMSEYAYGQIR
ncbi:hypothetical protein [Butyrivibrio sp. INlla21]|uniref:hypothetical protein n=1 Tax=Butyrivibrio sp. INlla21 TaxID=1520811 RepID=UPI0008E7DBFC|nr:hypothetical protein [Butyrivibrio sp. INlla21]SFU89975.1 hypothetical protein SAMN02910342_02293 [Butyrivibrio sp. INlla21]